MIKKRYHRILIIRLGSIGDILLTTPLIRMIKKQMGEVKIDFLVKKSFVPLIKENPHIHHIVPFNTIDEKNELWKIINQIRNSGYDAILDLQNNQRSFLIRHLSGVRTQRCFYPKRISRFLLVYLKINFYRKIVQVPMRYLKIVTTWGIVDDGEGLELNIDQKTEKNITELLNKNHIKIDKFLVLAPGAAHNTKRWPVKRFAEVGNYFAKRGMFIMVVGGKEDETLSKELVQVMDFPAMNYTGQLSLLETAALLKHSELIVTNDTGVMHMGSAFGCKLVVIFGPTTHHFGFLPFRTPAVIVEKSLSCRPCSYHGSAHCPKNHFKCMQEITSQEVIEAASNLIERKFVP